MERTYFEGFETHAADTRGYALPCRHCDILVDADRPATEDGTAHLDCAVAWGDLDARICTKCSSYSTYEITDAQGRCPDCVDRAEDEARAEKARELAIRALDASLGFYEAKFLSLVVHCESGSRLYQSTRGDLRTLRALESQGLIRCVLERSRPWCADRHWIATDTGRAVHSLRARRALGWN